MSSPILFRTFLFAVLGVTYVGGKVDDMGPCKQICNAQQNFNFDEFAREEGGSWKYQLVPKLDFFNPIQYAGVQYTPTETDGVYDINIYNLLKNGKKETFSNGRVTYLGNGRTINNATENGEGNVIFQSFYLKYVPEKYVYYYVCTRDGGDLSTDYRNVLVHKPLSKGILRALKKLDKRYGFKNELQELAVQP